MCKKTPYCNVRVDKCMRKEIKKWKNAVACCCGHGRYPLTLLVKRKGKIIEVMSGIAIPRTRNFYKQDKKGYYFIPEVSKERS